MYAKTVVKQLVMCESKMMLGSIACISVLLQTFKIYFALENVEIKAEIMHELEFLQSIEAE